MAVPPRVSAADRFRDLRAQQLADLIEPTVTAHGLYLEELALTTKGDRTALQVMVDFAEGTERVELDTLVALSEALSVTLDAAEDGERLSREKNRARSESSEAIEGMSAEGANAAALAALPHYELEVSTPGATRPLTEPRHYRRNIGRLLEIDLTAEARSSQGLAAQTARLKQVDESGVVVSEIIPAPKKGMKPKSGPDTHIGFESIARARVQVEFSHTEP